MRNLGRRALSHSWSLLNRGVRVALEKGWLDATRLPARVISVGNLQAGGTGKTPLVIQIAREAVEQGLQVAILSRGYRSVWEKSGGVIAPFEASPSPYLCGDEVALIHDQVPEAWIGVGADRVAQFEALASLAQVKGERSFDLAILDDALQHWRVARDLNVIAVTDAEFGERVFREGFSAVSPGDLVVLTKGATFPAGLPDGVARVTAEYAYPRGDRAQSYWFVCALGDPERAKRSLERAGFRILNHTFFRDHHPYTLTEIESLLREADGAGVRILLTGKDWVKWKSLGIPREKVEVVEPELRWTHGAQIWSKVLWDK